MNTIRQTKTDSPKKWLSYFSFTGRCLLVLLLLSFSFMANSQGSGNEANKLYHHWANTDMEWINGALHKNNSSYVEGDIVPHVYTPIGLTAGRSYSITIIYDYSLELASNTIGGFVEFIENFSPTQGLYDAYSGLTASENGDMWTNNILVTNVSAPLPIGSAKLAMMSVTVNFSAIADGNGAIYFGLKLADDGDVSANSLGAAAWPGASLQTRLDLPGVALSARTLSIMIGEAENTCEPTLGNETADVCVGKTTTLSLPDGVPAGGEWGSSNFSIATVDQSGVVTGVSDGTAIIIYDVFDENGCRFTIEYTVTVKPLPTVSITRSNPTLLVCAGDAATFSGPTGDNLTYLWEFVSGTGTISAPTSRVTNVTASAAYELKLTVTNTLTNCSNSTTISFTPTVCNGCTPGFWKNHTSKWGCGYSSTKSFWSVFVGISPTNRRGVTDLTNGDLNLIEAISAEIKTSRNNGHYAALARHAVAAILNACAFNYVVMGVDLTTAQIVADVTSAFNTGFAVNGTTTATQLAELYRIANETMPCPNATTITNTTNAVTVSAKETQLEVMVTKLSVSAAPNPFTDKIRFTLKAPTAGRATLEVYNMLGQKVGVPFEGLLNAGEIRNVDYIAPANGRSNIVYMLRMNGEQVSGKLMSTRQ